MGYVKSMVVSCSNCHKEFTSKRKESQYCSHRCAAIANNHKFPKIKKTYYYCQDCKKQISQGSKRCLFCETQRKIDLYGERTLASVRVDHLGTAYQWNELRKQAGRLMNRWKIPKICNECGWKYHVEVSHKKSISSFPLETKTKEVNSKKNLVYQCPNCHWLHEHWGDSSKEEHQVVNLKVEIS